MYKPTSIQNVLRFLKAWVFVTLCGSYLTAHSDDLEIYTSLTAGDGENPASNILFVLDTSGSMLELVATVFTGGEYDPNTTYGDGSSDGRVYIYNTGLNFTGDSFLTSLSVCDGMNTLHASSSSYPVYNDKLAQWLQTIDTITTPGACPDVDVDPEINLSDSIAAGDHLTALTQTIPADTAFTLKIETSEKIHSIKVNTISTGEFGPESSSRQCTIGNIKGLDSATCDITPDEFQTELEVTFFYYTQNTSTDVVITNAASDASSEEGGGGEACEADTVENVSKNDWYNIIEDTSNLGSIIECALDAGVHGIDDDSLDVFAKDCPFNKECATPKYSDKFANSLDFDASSALYVPANFHDFIQTGGDAFDTDGLPEGDFDSYCTDTGEEDEIFKDTTSGVVFQCQEKLGIMKAAISSLLQVLSNTPINIGLMRFNVNAGDDQGGTVINALDAIESNQAAFETALTGLTAEGTTPLQESIWEAYRYYAGLSREHGLAATTDSNAVTANDYNGPISDTCQNNNIILLSDGLPTDDNSNQSDIVALSGESCSDASGDCLNELTGALSRIDLSDSIDGTNTVKTYTIGFNEDIDALEEAANDGGGQYFTAGDITELQIVFQNIVLDILADSSTFVAPAVSVNAFNELQHRNEIYYALFEPDGTPRWPGNVKKYSVDEDGTVLDSNAEEAVEFATGFFKESAQSVWSDEVDGRAVTLGGAAEQLTNTREVFTHDDDGNLIELSSSNFADISADSISASNDSERDDFLKWMLGIDVFDDDNDSNLTEANQFIADPLHSRPFVVTYGGNVDAPEDVLFFTTNLGTLHAVDPSDTQGTELWSYLVDEHKDNLQPYIEAPDSSIHTYGLDGELTVVTTEAEGSVSSNFSLDSVQLYFGERRGGSRYYALDASNARINATPSETLDNSYSTPFKNLWKITGSVPDGSDLEFGLDYFLNNDADSGFNDLAQTWSKMVPTKLKHADGEIDVLVFSGGYDPRHDYITYSATFGLIPDYGNAIYIVNATTGELVYSIGNNTDGNPIFINRITDQHDLSLDMINSIPSTPTIVDVDGDGDVDTIFAVDVVGKVWRVDFNQTKALDGTGDDVYATGGLIADLSETGEVEGHVRRFYNSVDVSRSNPASGSDHLNIVVGSGYRASPSTIEEITNRLYILFDQFPRARTLDAADEDDRYAYFEDETVEVTQGQPIPDGRFRTVTAADLGESSFDDDDADTDDDIKSIFNSPNGIFINYDSGEKVLQRSTTFNGVVIVSTFNPDDGDSSGACGGSLGGGRVYVLDINTGLSVLKEFDNGTVVLDDEGNPVIADFYQLQHQGIPAETTSLLLPSLAVCIGTECNIDPIEEAMQSGFETGRAYRTFWRED